MQTGINSSFNFAEDIFSLNKNGVSGKSGDDLHFLLNGSGVTFGDQDFTYTFNANGIYGDGWSISPAGGIVGIPFSSFSFTDEYEYSFQDGEDTITDTKVASVSASGQNGISLSFYSQNNIEFLPSGFLIKDGVTAFNGLVTAPTPATGQNDTSIATTAFVKAQAYAPLASPIFTGNPQAPTPAISDSDTSIATTSFVKNQGYALLTSPTFTGDPKAPTPATGDNDTSIATTAFVKAQAYATLASPTFTGDPKAPTPLTTDNDTSIATTAFVKAQNYITSSALTGYATETYVGSQGYITSSALTPYLLSATASTTYYPLGSNPSGYITSSALTGYATETYVGSQGYITSSALTPYLLSATASTTYYPLGSNPSGYITSSALTGYAPLAGSSFTGKVNFSVSATDASINIGSTLLTSIPTNATNGDIWLQDTGTPPTISPKLYFRANNSTFNVATVGTSNVFSRNQTISASTNGSFNLDITQSGNGGGLKITNTGTGESLRVEDETSPDATAFVVSNNGRVGIGVAPDTTVALTVDATGVKFNDSSVQVTKGDRYKATSQTSNTVDSSNGKSFTTQPNLAYTPYQKIVIVATGTSNHMHGQVVSYDSTTGVLVFDADTNVGSGTHTNWTINVGG